MASHWYDSEGNCRYTVPRASGTGERDTTKADARKLKLVPSVTSILSILDKPALTRWLGNEIMEAAIANPYVTGWTDSEEWKRNIQQESQRKSREAAERGNQIHNALEQYYLGNPIPTDLLDYCTPVIELLYKEFGKVDWIPEASFMHPLGFGGKCDLHLKPCEEYPNGIILDFKTKSAEDFTKVKAYDEQCMQVVAYREGFKIPEADCYDLFISTNTPDLMLLHHWDEKDCGRNWNCFKHLVEAWKLINKFNLTE